MGSAPAYILAAAALAALPAFCTAQGYQPHHARGPTTCDAALNKTCGEHRGNFMSCHSCLKSASDPNLAVGTPGSNCTAEDLDAFCTPGLNKLHAKSLIVYHVNPTAYPAAPSW